MSLDPAAGCQGRHQPRQLQHHDPGRGGDPPGPPRSRPRTTARASPALITPPWAPASPARSSPAGPATPGLATSHAPSRHEQPRQRAEHDQQRELPCASRSATHGFQIARTTTTARSPRPGGSASLAAPTPSSTRAPTSASCCQTQPGASIDAVAATASSGTARGSVGPRPNHAGSHDIRGTATMSRTSTTCGPRAGASSSTDSPAAVSHTSGSRPAAGTRGTRPPRSGRRRDRPASGRPEARLGWARPPTPGSVP
jgi:hypothetical protein